jgi:hypothetical protein
MVILAFGIDIIRCKETVLRISKAYVKKELLNCEITNVGSSVIASSPKLLVARMLIPCSVISIKIQRVRKGAVH